MEGKELFTIAEKITESLIAEYAWLGEKLAERASAKGDFVNTIFYRLEEMEELQDA